MHGIGGRTLGDGGAVGKVYGHIGIRCRHLASCKRELACDGIVGYGTIDHVPVRTVLVYLDTAGVDAEIRQGVVDDDAGVCVGLVCGDGELDVEVDRVADAGGGGGSVVGSIRILDLLFHVMPSERFILISY